MLAFFTTKTNGQSLKKSHFSINFIPQSPTYCDVMIAVLRNDRNSLYIEKKKN